MFLKYRLEVIVVCVICLHIDGDNPWRRKNDSVGKGEGGRKRDRDRETERNCVGFR